MVYPVNNIRFRVGLRGLSSAENDMAIVRDMETFSVNFDNGIEEWTAIDQEGWSRRLVTAKSVTVSLSGKRNYNDAGNNYIASLAYENGMDACTLFEAVFPDGSVLRMNCIINVSASDGGDATSVAALEFDCMSDGKPTYTRG